jgi:hypothetical protein
MTAQYRLHRLPPDICLRTAEATTIAPGHGL